MLSLTYFFSRTDEGQQEFSDRIKEHCQKNELVFVDICIDDQEELKNKYEGQTPVVCVGPYVLRNSFTDTELQVATRSAFERQTRLSTEGNEQYEKKVKNGVSINNLDRFSYFFSRSYVIILSTFLALFIIVPFLAPVLYKTGHKNSANIIYKVYHVICHQLAFRSFYLFGEQPYYPRELANIDGKITYEQIIGTSTIDLEYARAFIGNEHIGYKVAICERDVAIYGSLALFGFVFQLSKKKIRQLPWYLWFLIALVPIAIDGLSQIPGLSSNWPAWVPIRESTPVIRIITGTLFGVGTGWYMYPMMEESMKETRITLHRKFAIINKLNQTKKMVDHETSL